MGGRRPWMSRSLGRRPFLRPGQPVRGPVRILFPLLAALFLVAGAGALDGQEVDREGQVPIAPELGVLEISQSLRAELELFPEIQGFRVARLFLREDGGTVLELEYMRDNQLRRERRLLSDQDLRDFQDRVALQLGERDPRLGLDREGRGRLVFDQTLLGLGFHGWAVPTVLDIDSAQGAVAAYLLTAGAAFYVPYRLSRDRPVSEAHRDLAWYGGSRGILYGVLLGDALADRDSDHVDRIRLAGGLAASWGGAVLGYATADRFTPDEGTAELWSALGDFGLGAGAASAFIAGPYATRDVVRDLNGVPVVESRTRNRSVGHAIAMAGGVGGLLAGRWLGERQLYTKGNVRALESAVVLGAQSGVTLARAATDDDRTLVAGGLAGGLGALVGGNRLLREKRFSSGEGLLVNAGHLAGAATALGLTYLAVEEIDEHPLLYLATGTAGSLVGAGLVFRALGEGSGPSVGLGGSSVPNTRWRRGATLSLHPENLLLTIATIPGPGEITTPIPLLSIRF